MNEMEQYIESLKQELADAQQAVNDALAAGNFLNTPEGQLVQNWVNAHTNLLIAKITSASPSSDRDYLSIHGGIRVLTEFNNMLQSKANSLDSAVQRVDDANAKLQQAG